VCSGGMRRGEAAAAAESITTSAVAVEYSAWKTIVLGSCFDADSSRLFFFVMLMYRHLVFPRPAFDFSFFFRRAAFDFLLFSGRALGGLQWRVGGL